MKYIDINLGSTFGLVDIVGSMLLDKNRENFSLVDSAGSSAGERQFSTMSEQANTEVLYLSVP